MGKRKCHPLDNPIPDAELSCAKINKLMANNFQVLVSAYIEFFSKANSDMTEEDLKKLFIEISDKNNIPNDLIKKM